MVDLSIIIVNWNSVGYLRPCLESIYKSVCHITFEVIIVDNASYDGTEDLLKAEFPQVTYLQSTINLGFARANNLGVHHASGRFILVLNPDTQLVDDSVTAMMQVLESNERIGAVGCCLLNSDLTVQRSLQAFPTIWNQLLAIELLQRTFPTWRLWGTRALFETRDDLPEVDVLSGSCVMLRRQVFDEVGMFTEEYFMYSDDVDLCYKIRHAGYEIRFLPSKKIIHHGGTSSAFRPENQFSTVMQRESRVRFFRRTRGRVYATAYKMAMGCSAVARLIVILFMMPFASLLREPPPLTAAARKWWVVLRWALGRERWVSSAAGEG